MWLGIRYRFSCSTPFISRGSYVKGSKSKKLKLYLERWLKIVFQILCLIGQRCHLLETRGVWYWIKVSGLPLYNYVQRTIVCQIRRHRLSWLSFKLWYEMRIKPLLMILSYGFEQNLKQSNNEMRKNPALIISCMYKEHPGISFQLICEPFITPPHSFERLLYGMD